MCGSRKPVSKTYQKRKKKERIIYLGWADFEPGALLALPFQFHPEVSGQGLAGLIGDPVAGNLELGLGVDALLGSRDVSLLLKVEVSAHTAHLVLQHTGWDNRDQLAVEAELIQVQAWGPEDDNSIDSPGQGGNAVSNGDGLGGWNLNCLTFEGDLGSIASRPGWTHGDQVVLQVDLQGLLAALNSTDGDSEAHVLGAVSSQEMFAVRGGEGDGLVVEGGDSPLINLARWSH